MTLEQLKAALARHKVALSLSPTGGLRYDAPQQIPVTLLEGMKAHKAQLLTQLGSPATTSSDPQKPKSPDTQAPTCATCAHWQALEGWGYQMGKCSAAPRYFAPGDGAGLAIRAGHHCPSMGGKAWTLKQAPALLANKGRELTFSTQQN